MIKVAGSGLVLACTILAQAPTPKLEFEVASVRQAAPRTPAEGVIWGKKGGPGTSDPERVTYRLITLWQLLGEAYGGPADRLIMPDWVLRERYDVTAKIPRGTTKEQYAVMLRNLLVARLQIVSHSEKRDFPVYNLVVAKGGLKMKPYTGEATPAPGPTTPLDPAAAAAQLDQLDQSLKKQPANDGFPVLAAGTQPAKFTEVSKDQWRTSARGQPMSEIVGIIQDALGGGARVTDKTGLTGRYDFKLQSTRQPNAADPDSMPDVVTAVQSQLGLRLEKGIASFDVIVIDHLEKTPFDN